ncbi:MAG TPA: glycine oxidase ThiO [Candidatus Omnitrophota bacterium]|nr:glycine oxidase ThiO [Candidatus Omnitrophota bacterium]
MKNFDAVVVGGGLVGLCIACELREAKLSVAVVEREACGQEASTAAAGVLAPHAGPRLRTPFFGFLRRALEIFPDFIGRTEQETGIDTDFFRSELLYVAFDQEEKEALEQRYRWQVDAGVKAEWLPPDRVRELEPCVAAGALNGIYFPEDCQVNNERLVCAVKKLAEKLGAEIFEHNPALKFRIENGKITGVETREGVLNAPVAVNAAGAWGNFDPSLPFRIPLKPSRGQILLFDQDRPCFRRVLHIPGTYAVTRRDGKVLVGSTVESAGYDKRVTAKGIRKLSGGLVKISGDPAPFRFCEARAGLRPRSRDNQPILGDTPVGGLVLAVGHFRNGILLAPITAKVIAETILKKPLSFDIRPFDVLRFPPEIEKTKRRKR